MKRQCLGPQFIVFSARRSSSFAPLYVLIISYGKSWFFQFFSVSQFRCKFALLEDV